jgi:hypothetical protein
VRFGGGVTEEFDVLEVMRESRRHFDELRAERAEVEDPVSTTPSLDPVPTPSPSWLLDAADLLAEPDPGPTPWLVQGLMVDRALIAVVGKWKTTKSYGLLELEIAIATGRPAFGHLIVPEPGPVVFINEESGKAALWRRLDALCRGRAIDPEELRARLYVAANARIKLDDPGWQNELVAIGRELRPRLITFDPLARMKAPARSESAQNEMSVVVEFLRYLRDETQAAVAFVQHTGHHGEHMRGSSDLESVWESRLAWKREGESPTVEIESAHREAESMGTVAYRIDWDHATRSMRFELERDPLEVAVRDYLRDHPEASANEVNTNVDGTRETILSLVKRIRSEGGSAPSEPPPNHPPRAPIGVVRQAPLSLPKGERGPEPPTTPGSAESEPPLTDAEIERLAERARKWEREAL